MSDSFYRAFEEKYRGSRELIKSRLQIYLPFVQPLLQVNSSCKALDLGCGRGEWLELLGEQGFEATGVDLDDGMLQACRDLKLDVQNADAVTYLNELPTASVCVVSGFHIAEHLPIEELKMLVQHALRVLTPGGLLILETPNPENISVGSNSFYMDPTHQRPIPPELLSFLPEHVGFQRWKVLRLQESPHLHNNQGATLIEVLRGVSPDYAVIAQKAGADELYEPVNKAFEAEYGVSLERLAQKFQDDFNARSDLRVQLQKALEVAHAAQEQAQKLGVELKQTIEQADEQLMALKAMETEHLQQIETLSNQLEASRQELKAVHESNNHHRELAQQRQGRIDALLNSRSWRITSPLRWPAHQQRLLRQYGLEQRVRSVAKKALRKVVSGVTAHPRLADRARRLINRFPRVKARLLRFFQYSPIENHFAGPVKKQSQDLIPTDRFEPGTVAMSFIGSNFASVSRLPDCITAWWREQNIDSPSRENLGRLRVLQITTYAIDKPDHGGKLRCHHIRRALRTRFYVETLSFEWGERADANTTSVVLDQRNWGDLSIDGIMSDWGISIYLEKDAEIYSQVGNLVHDYSPDVIVLEQPFLWPLVERFMKDGVIDKDTKLIYSSHNVEVDMKRKIYENYYPSDQATKYLEYVSEIEIDVIRACSAAIAVSEADVAYLKDVSPQTPVGLYSNGHSKLGSNAEDQKWRERFAAQDRNWVFVGSWHPPNINGLRDLLLALRLLGDQVKGLGFWVLGSVGTGFLREVVDFRLEDYPWLNIIGPVSTEDIESAIMCSSGVVLPIWEGGGSNLKTAQGLLSRKCVLGSEYSFRGFEHYAHEDGVSIAVSPNDLARLMVSTYPQELYLRSENVTKLTWESILESLPEFISDVVV